MFDSLREDANSTPFYEDEAAFNDAQAVPAEPKSKKKASAPGHFLGMTPVQRFIIAVMLLIAVCSLGSMCLLVTGKLGF
ncbi:MAG TPA: hypothetical protein VMJ64_07435 [Anaerolineales bacterium]|nr:hypothetical protein [Anaerolineales bacterium]